MNASKLINLYRRIFCRRIFYPLNKALFFLSLKGIGIGNWETSSVSGESDFIARVAKIFGSPTVIDIGANVGHYSNAVMQLSPSARIYAFEPHPSTFKALTDSAQKYGYHAFNVACSDKVGKGLLFDHADAAIGTEHASLVPNVIEAVHASSSASYKVDVTTLDLIVDELEISSIDLLKIDVEGAELSVLRGAKDLLKCKKIAVIQFEFTEASIQTRVFMRDFAEILKDYEMFRMLPDGLVALGKYYPPVYEIFGYQNIVAIRSEVTTKFL